MSKIKNYNLLFMNKENIKKIVKGKYKEIATSGSSCGCACSCGNTEDISKDIGYSEEDLNTVGEANLGLGCGSPLAYGKIEKGDVVLDLGSGAGIDAILAAKKVGEEGRVIGVDITEEMIEKAKQNVQRRNINNIEFLLGDLEDLPLKSDTVDVIITNCVVNLTPDKSKAFSEAYRVLKKEGRMYLSDIVLLEELSEDQRNNEYLLSGCVAGALLRDDYLKKIEEVGFKIDILKENKEISKKQYGGIPLESLTVELVK